MVLSQNFKYNKLWQHHNLLWCYDEKKLKEKNHVNKKTKLES